MLGVHVFLGGVSTLEEMVRNIFEELLKTSAEQPWYSKIGSFFGTHVRDVGLFGVSVSFNPPVNDLTKLVHQFPEAIHNVLDKIKQDKKGLCLVLDDINGLADTPALANWFKSFVDRVATHGHAFPVLIMLVGTNEKRDRLLSHQESLSRVFRIVEIERLTDEEVGQFFEKSFAAVEYKITAEARDELVNYSSGLPVLMQELGDATFWEDADRFVEYPDALKGVILASANIGKKYLTPKVYNAIRSKHYRSILRKFPDRGISRLFKRKDIESMLNSAEKKVFNNFLRRLRELGVIEPDSENERGSYKFANSIYPVYISMEAALHEQRKT